MSGHNLDVSVFLTDNPDVFALVVDGRRCEMQRGQIAGWLRGQGWSDRAVHDFHVNLDWVLCERWWAASGGDPSADRLVFGS